MSGRSRATRGGRPIRQITSRAVKRSLLVFTEGERTEVDYLTHWRREHRFEVSVEIDERHGRDPLTLVQLALEAKQAASRDARRGRGGGYDAYWCVFDVDDHATLARAVALASPNEINIAVSNPCFELWLLLHYQDQRAWVDRDAVQREFRSASGATDKNLPSAVVIQLAQAFADAKRRAQDLATMHTRNGCSVGENPGTDVWMIVDSIRS